MRQKQMTTPIFTVEKISNVEIEVVHEEGHHFTFPLVIDKNGRRVLSEGGKVSNGGLAKHNADYFAFGRGTLQRQRRATPEKSTEAKPPFKRQRGPQCLPAASSFRPADTKSSARCLPQARNV
jgi:hypothetical protein